MTRGSASVADRAKKIYDQSRFREAKRDNDTVRLWENYREQALLWRAIAIIQIPATILACALAIVIFNNRETVLNVPARPLPGYYSAYEITDDEFLGVAREFVNLIASYRPKTARRQFREAAKWLQEPMLTRFEKEMIGRELKVIENTMRTQVYFVDPTETEVIRYDNENFVVIIMSGQRLKLVAGESLPAVVTRFRITMNTIPRNKLNPYGIVIRNVETTTTQR